jgi:hypothetical protein
MSKSEKFWKCVSSFNKTKLTSARRDVGESCGAERNKVVNPFAEYFQSAYNNPFPEVFTTTTTPHPITVGIKTTGFNINSYSEIFVTALKYIHPHFTSAVILNPTKASSSYLCFFFLPESNSNAVSNYMPITYSAAAASLTCKDVQVSIYRVQTESLSHISTSCYSANM